MTTLIQLDPVAGTTCCTTATTIPLEADRAEALARDLRVLADSTRLRLLSLIAAHPEREACVCDLTDPVGLSQPTVSHHLKLLVEAGYLTRTKRGTWAYYRLVADRLTRVGPELLAAIN